MTDLNKVELRRLAEASAENESWYEPDDFHAGRVTELELDVVSEADRSFIVSASPATILSLLDELEKAQEIGRISCNFDGYKSVLDERDQLRAEVEALRKDAMRYRKWRAIAVRVGATQEEFDLEWDKAMDSASAEEGNANG